MAIYQFYAELEGYKPKIWRKFQVDENITVARLGYTVMAMYEMQASHLLAFEYERSLLTPSGRKSSRMELIDRYGIPNDFDDDFGFDDKDATKTRLSELQLEEPYSLLVWYDFGDDWRVRVTLEEVQNNSDLLQSELPRVFDGKGFGIVEDCGGIYGLADLADAYKTKRGKEYKQYREWLGVDDFDLAAFNIDEMNIRVKKLPDIYAKIYEKKRPPTQKEIRLITRR